MYDNPPTPIESSSNLNISQTTQLSSLLNFYSKYKKHIITFSNIIVMLITLFLARNTIYECVPDAMFSIWNDGNNQSPTPSAQVSKVSPSPIINLSPTETNSYITSAPTATLTPTIMVLNTRVEVWVEKACSGGTMIDTNKGYSIACPNNFWTYTYMPHNLWSKNEEFVRICETRKNVSADDTEYGCPDGGIVIWANGDGWGGSCETANINKVNIDGKEATYCLVEDGFTQLSLGDPNSDDPSSNSTANRYWISGSFSKTFTKEDAMNIMKTFKEL